MMPGGWEHSTGHTRTSTAEWKATRLQVLDRDGWTCRLQLPGCIGHANAADHIVSPLHGGTDDPSNLRAACGPCHGRRTSAQGNAARERQNRPPEPHPGLA